LFGTALDGDQFGTTAAFIGLNASASESECPWFRTLLVPPVGWLSNAVAKDARAVGSAPPSPLGGVAVVHVASVGFHELFVNGVKVSDDVLAPSVSDLGKRILVRSYDITAHVLPGKTNAVGLWLGPGWAMFSAVNPHIKNLFNTSKAPLVAASIRFHSGADLSLSKAIGTDGTWAAKTSAQPTFSCALACFLCAFFIDLDQDLI
jgi:hypothetical protein